MLALSRNHTGVAWGSYISIETRDGKVHELIVPHSELTGDGNKLFGHLKDHGLQAPLGAKRDILKLLDTWLPAARVMSLTTLGWSEDLKSFVLKNGVVLGQAQAERVVLDASIAKARVAKGDLGNWQSNIANSAQGNPVLMFALSVAFTGPLLQPLAVENGGVNLIGASSRGKSTALRLAATVWGAPSDMVSTWRATTNGLEGAASVANSTCLILDELGQVEPQEAGKAAYMLGNGQGKQRADQLGAAREVAAWRMLFLSSGEISLADKLVEDRGRRIKAGQSVRLLDIPSTERAYGVFDDLCGHKDGANLANALNQAAEKNYGHAGPKFVEKLLADLSGSQKKAQAFVKRFEEQALNAHPHADGQVKRAAKRFGLIAAAGELASEFGIVRWPSGEATQSALVMFNSWLTSRGGTVSKEKTDTIRAVRSFLSENREGRFRKLQYKGGWKDDDENRPPIHKLAGWYMPKHNGKPGIYLITADTLRDEILNGLDLQRPIKYLRESGLLITDNDGRHNQMQAPICTGQKRAYAIHERILSADDTGNPIE